ncbi:WhiB family transcriptional regulator [Streptomyces cellulosae]
MAECSNNPDKWFSEDPENIAQAKAACDRCPAREECATLGEDEEYGIWGGMTPDDRRSAKRFRLLLREEIIEGRIRNMQKQGLSISAMARELSIPRKTLADRLRRMTDLAA